MITKKAKIILLGGEGGNLFIDNNDKLSIRRDGNTHMYFVTDEEPGAKDVAVQVNGVNKKVIATNDAMLDLPRPSIRFIKKFVDMYNNNTPIQSVYVEYMPIYGNLNPYKDTIIFDEEYERLINDLGKLVYVPKVNPKNNTIVIRKKVNDIPKDVLNNILLRFTERYAVKLFNENYSKDPILFKDLPNFISNWIKEEL